MRKRRHAIPPALVIAFGFFWMWVCVGPWAAAQDNGNSAGTSAVTFEPARLTVSQGGTASAKVTVALKSGKAGATTLKATDLPSGLAITFEPPSGQPTFTSTMRVRANPTVTAQTYTVKLQAAGGDPSSVVSYAITVERTGGY